jgi:ABC-2 type transport system ATP-binding protein
MTYAVETKELSKQYKTSLAVDGINIAVPKGCCCGFLGRNGAGKTTTIKMLVGLAKPTGGSITIMGQPRRFGYCDNSNIGYLPDVPNFYNYMTGAEYLNFCGRLYDMDEKKRKARIDKLLKQVDLYGIRTRISGFSRGMKQRLGIAQALMNEPEIIFLDEPASALDPIGRHDVINIIRSLQGETTVFLSTHILSDVEEVCDYAMIIEKGKIVASDTVEQMKEKHVGDAGKIRLYNQSDGDKFIKLMGSQETIKTKDMNNGEYLLSGMPLNELSQHILPLVANANIPIESYQAHVPSMEEIFLEVTKHA